MIAGSATSVEDQLIDVVDQLGPFGTLVSVGHDWDKTDLWQNSIRRLAEKVRATGCSTYAFDSQSI